MDTRDMFARMIKCEAGGEGEHGMRAVATVIMNRVRVPYGEYQRLGQGDLRRLLAQEQQFQCYEVELGGIPNNQNIWVIPADAIHYQIADWAMNNNIHSGTGEEALWYMNPFIPDCPNFFPYNRNGYWFTRIGDHCIYNPTAGYADT